MTPAEIPDASYLHERLLESDLFWEDAIDWMVAIIRNQIAAGRGLLEVERAVRRSGAAASKDQKKAHGLRGNAVLGRDFLFACKPDNVRDASEKLLYIIMDAHSEWHRRRRLHEIVSFGHIRAWFCASGYPNACTAAVTVHKQEFNTADLPIELPLVGCDAKSCGCWFMPVIES